MQRREFFLGASALALIPRPADAMWFVPFLLQGLGRMAARQAASLTLRRAATRATVARGAASGAGQIALSAQQAAAAENDVVPYGARPENRRARESAERLLSAAYQSPRSFEAVARGNVLSTARREGEDGPLPAIIAYYYLLKHGNAREERTFWVNPVVRTGERWRDGRQDYEIVEARTLFNDGATATVYVDVYGRNGGESWRRWQRNISLVFTQYGWLVTRFASA
ncbi:MAG: hypothetical protein FKY71_20230 [Spiribacter salinus]|uniref:Uncharacterized protein n=1 Tax=Spiribacter salinus TaxID=1335746 RepID=A0A540V3J7_9GAMM|nr:MAG: hypothetical protein FKY71_20230 [Spiribacter salinus]